MDIRQYIRDEIERGSSLQPREIAATIYDRMNDTQRAEAFAVALPALVQQVIIGTRPSTQRAVADNVTAIRQPGRSWKREHFQSGAWRKELDAIYATPAGNKRLADFSADELYALAATCRDLAHKNAAAADRWERLADATRDAKVERLADVDETSLRALLAA